MSVEVTRLPTGLAVITDEMSHLQTASLGVWVGCGSRYEAPDEHGISHFLEHMAFKGTARRTARQIAEEIEAVGGDLNAGTGVEMTAYYARVLKTDIGLAANRDFNGSATSTQQNTLQGAITAVVQEVLPNGLLRITGDKTLSLNQGEEFIRLRGFVRAADIDRDNRVSSQRIADARIA